MIKKIFFILPDLRCGGAEKVFINIANNLPNNYQSTFILLEDRGKMKKLLSKDIEIISLQSKRIRASFFKLIKLFNNTSNSIFLSAMWPLNSIVLLASLFSRKNNEFYISEHVNLSKSKGIDFKTSKILLFLSISLTYLFAKKIICVSDGVKKDLKKYLIFGKEKLITIHNPIYLKENKIFQKYKSKKQILNVATLKLQKDHKTLLNAFSMLDNKDSYHLNIVGDGVMLNDLIQHAKSLNIENHVTFHGYREDVDIYYSEADIFILSSIYEGFCNVLVEALSFGVNIISTDCESGPKEILKNGRYGILVPVNDPKAIAQSIKIIQSKPFDSEYLKKRAKDFKIDKIIKEYINLFEKI